MEKATEKEEWLMELPERCDHPSHCLVLSWCRREDYNHTHIANLYCTRCGKHITMVTEGDICGATYLTDLYPYALRFGRKYVNSEELEEYYRLKNKDE